MPLISIHEITPLGWVEIPPPSHRRRALWVVVPMVAVGVALLAIAGWMV